MNILTHKQYHNNTKPIKQ